MKKGKLIAIIAIIAVIFAIFWGIGTRNTLVTMKEEVRQEAANIETQLQRRSDLIPNFVETVKGYAKHETEVYTAIADARAKLAGAGDDIGALNEAQNEFESALSRLLVVVENYPELKASQNFVAFQDELAGTENRIAIARENYNDVVASFNKEIVQFPNSLIASFCGIEEAEYFKAAEGADKAPSVQF